MSSWRVARSLETLRDQVNDLAPSRDKSSDGTIGDTSHAARKSDHNPNAAGVVQALDITNDPAHGVVSRALAEALVASRDPRIKYVISNRQICSSKQSPWTWRSYSGANAHEKHCHLSVLDDPALYDDTRPWAVTAEQLSGGKVAQPPATLPPAGTLPSPAPVSRGIEDRIRELLIDMSEAATASRASAFSLFRTSLLSDVDAFREKIASFDPSSSSQKKPAPAPPAPRPPPAPSAPVVTGDNPVSLVVSERLRTAGVSEAGIAGVLGNIKQESDFNPKSREADQPKFGGEAHYAHGLFQMGGDEWTHYDAWLQGRDWTDPANQVDFMIDNLQKHYPRVWAQIRDASDPETAALAFSSGYEKPSPKFANNANRVKWAQHYFANKKIVAKQEAPVSQTSPGSVIADVKPATHSKINITEVGAVVAHGAALWIGQKLGLDATMQGLVQMGVQAVFSTSVVIMRTWFTTTILKQSAPKV